MVQEIKKIDDFDELKRNNLRGLSLEHFEQGLDNNCYLDYIYYNNGQKFKNRHVLAQFLFVNNSIYIDEKTRLKNKENSDFVKKTLLSLFEENKISKEEINRFMFDIVFEGKIDTSIVKFFINNNMCDIDARNKRGKTLLMCLKDKTSISKLMDLGFDITATCNNKDYVGYYGKDIYDVAVINEDNSLLSYLRKKMPIEIISKKQSQNFLEFKKERYVSEQLKRFIVAIKENDINVAYEVRNNQGRYKELIEYLDISGRDGIPRDLIGQIISYGGTNFLPIILEIDFYKNQKEKIWQKHSNKLCYTSVAFRKNKIGIAKILYEHGYFVKDSVINSLNYNLSTSPTILNLLIDDGFKASIEQRKTYGSMHKIECENYNDFEIEDFFNKNKNLIKLNIQKDFSGNLFSSYNQHGTNIRTYLSDDIIKLSCFLLKKFKEKQEDLGNKLIKQFISSFKDDPHDLLKNYIFIILKELPEYKNEIFNNLNGDRKWVVNLLKKELKDLPMVKKNKKIKM